MWIEQDEPTEEQGVAGGRGRKPEECSVLEARESRGLKKKLVSNVKYWWDFK